MQLKTIQTQRVPVRYYESGEGKPLVFLHGAGGLDMDMGFLATLAQKFHVFAPLVPGYGDSEECEELRDMLDFTLHTWDVVDRLGLKDPILAGFSMGGMIASEMAAVAPNDVSRLALIAAAGLWMDEHPIPDIFAMLPYQLPDYLFYDVEAGAKIMSAGTNMSDPKFLQAFLVQNARQLGAAGKILFPIPERGLASRLYRIKARTMLIWGEGDKLVPPVYAKAFKQGIASSEIVMIPRAGHVVPFEKPTEVIGAIARLQ
ncbi:MAG TPA: alpha/beta hydrolase [Bryobacteraceae bacterium]|jgi:pimeloyl-ACP methyl ester carboxylesterase|nr:alpha/beta hydrolase [Bryobacteraceae bacterium]